MKKQNLFIAAVTAFIVLMNIHSAEAQNDNVADTVFHPHGSPIVTVYTNINVKSAEKTTYGFDLERVYLGYQYEFVKGLSGKVVFDIGKSSDVKDIQRLAYVKNALVQWNYAGLTLKVGLIGLNQFSLQEKLWGHRYLLKPFQDEYKFGNSADLGLSVAYKFVSWFSADIAIVNGEGYKKLQNDNQWLYTAGLTFNPVKPLTIRFYGDFNAPGKDVQDGKTKENLAAFVGLKMKRFSIGVENNWLFNTGYTSDHHQMGISAYSTVALGKKWEIFGRWDYLTSKAAWNKDKDGNLALLGCQYSPVKHVKIAPNFRLWVPADSQTKMTFSAFLNFELKI